ncbi:MAG: PIN domain-containing protein [Nitrospinae bacterium]|nr:PIN domain-containing protein [Nitrospinota bacterium]MBI3813472.1 PIN domain-containing protein [Nitrospinota bacterium]
MIYILDTDICIYWLKGIDNIKDKIEQIGLKNIHTTIITTAELYHGAFHSIKVKENLKSVENFIKIIKPLPITKNSAKGFGRIKSELKRQGKIIDNFDILIASIVLDNEGILVTNNIGHFNRIKKLRIENWMTEP